MFDFVNVTPIGQNEQFYVSAIAGLVSATTSDVAEPATLSLFGVGLVALGASLRRRRNARM